MSLAEKIDLGEAMKTSLMITTSFAVTIAALAFAARTEFIELELPEQTPYGLVVFGLVVIFNLAFSANILDQMWE